MDKDCKGQATLENSGGRATSGSGGTQPRIERNRID